MATRPRAGPATLRLRLPAQTDLDAFADDAALLAHPFEAAYAGQTPARATLGAMPAAAHLEIVLPAYSVRVVPLRVPAAKPMLVRRALPALIEDLVIGDASDCHAVVLPGLRDDGLRDVAIVDRRWMQLAQRIARVRRPKKAVVISEAWLVPTAMRNAFIALDGDRGFVRHRDGVLPLTVEHDASMPGELRLIRPALGDGPVPIAGVSTEQARAWADALGLALQPVPWRWWNAPTVDAAWSLLTDTFARGTATGATDWRAWRVPIGLAGACALAAVVGLNLHWWSLVRERNALQSQIERTFRDAFPSETVVVDPVQQAKRLVAVSAPTDDPYLAATEALASALDADGPVPSLKTLEWRAQTLRVKLVPTVDAAKVAEALQVRGYDVVRDTAGSDGAQPLVIRKKAQR